jgi:hypothetical protein
MPLFKPTPPPPSFFLFFFHSSTNFEAAEGMVGKEAAKEEGKKGKLGIEVSNTYVLLLFSFVMRQKC